MYAIENLCEYRITGILWAFFIVLVMVVSDYVACVNYTSVRCVPIIPFTQAKYAFFVGGFVYLE